MTRCYLPSAPSSTGTASGGRGREAEKEKKLKGSFKLLKPSGHTNYYGLVFGGSKTVLRGRVSNITRASDIAGVYAAGGAGLAVGSGARAIVLANQKGAVLELSGRQVGLLANVDLSGLAITLK